MSTSVTVIMNLISVSMILFEGVFLRYGFDYIGPRWFRVLIWSVAAVASIPMIVVMASLLVGSVSITVWLLSVKRRLLIIGIAFFVSARLAILAHG